MQSSFGNILKYHMSSQLVVRIFSSLMNLYLVRVVDLSLLGFISVRMTLLYQTVSFLSREPFRKTCLDPNLSIKDSIHYSLLSPALFIVLGTVYSIVWWFLPLPDVELDCSYGWIVLIFVCSAFLEGFVEPIALLSLKINDNAHYSLSHSLLSLLQKLTAVGMIMLRLSNPLTALCIAQLGASLCYALMHLRKFYTQYYTHVGDSFHGLDSLTFYSYESKYLKLIGTILAHSFLKQFLTSGSGYIMTFTNIFSLKTQAVYDVVDRLASLITRLVLTPLEESAAIYFASILHRPSDVADMSATDAAKPSNPKLSSDNVCVPEEAVVMFSSLLRVLIIMGLVVCVFGVPYSSTVVRLYGGEALVQNEGGKFLALYTVYLFFMALNGIIECFAFSSMNTQEIFSHGTFLFFSAVLHLLLNIALAASVGASGFIMANCSNTILRILYNWRHIRTIFAGRLPRQLSVGELQPNVHTFIIITFSFLVIILSLSLFGSTGGYFHTGAHLAVGAAMFLLVVAHIYHSENLLTNFHEKIH